VTTESKGAEGNKGVGLPRNSSRCLGPGTFDNRSGGRQDPLNGMDGGGAVESGWNRGTVESGDTILVIDKLGDEWCQNTLLNCSDIFSAVLQRIAAAAAQAFDQTAAVHGPNLIRQRRTRRTYATFRRLDQDLIVLGGRVGSQRHYHNNPVVAVVDVACHDHGWTGLFDLVADRGIKRNQPNVAAAWNWTARRGGSSEPWVETHGYQRSVATRREIGVARQGRRNPRHKCLS